MHPPAPPELLLLELEDELDDELDDELEELLDEEEEELDDDELLEEVHVKSSTPEIYS